MLDALIKAIQNNQTETFMLAAIIVAIVWLYKEIRNTYIETEKMNNERVNKALEIYAELQIELCNYSDNQTSLEAKLIKAYPYLPKNLLSKFIDWKIWKKEEDTNTLLKELGEEIFRIKRIQRDAVSYKAIDSIDSMEYFLNSIKAASFVQPLKLFLVTIISVSCILVAINVFLKSDVFRKIYVVFISVDLVFYFLFAMIFVGVLYEKRFINKIKNWGLLILFVFVPAFMLGFKQWYLPIIAFVLFLIYINRMLPKSVRKA